MHEPRTSRADMATHTLHMGMSRVLIRGVFRTHHLMTNRPAKLIRVHILHARVGSGGYNRDIQHCKQRNQAEEPHCLWAARLDLWYLAQPAPLPRTSPHS